MRTNTVVISLLLFLLVPLAASAGGGCNSVVWSTHQAAVPGTYPSHARNLRAIDYDNDNKLDLVGTIDQTGSSSSAAMFRWRGVGDGTFEAPVAMTGGPESVAEIEVANINQDSWMDVVVIGSQSIRVFFGNGSGFDPSTYQFLDYHPWAMHLVDADGDTYPDLVISAIDKFVRYRGLGTGQFSEQRRVSVTMSQENDWPMGIGTADFDGDGRFDVVIGRRVTKKFEVYFRNSDGSYASPVAVAAGEYPTDVHLGDFDENGLMDFAAAEWIDGDIVVAKNLGSRSFSRQILPATQVRQMGEMSPLEIADVNGDNHLDLVGGAINGGWVITYLGTGTGSFTAPSWFQPDAPPNNYGIGSIEAADFDNDGDKDLAIGRYQRLMTAKSTCATQVTLFTNSPVISTGQLAPLRVQVSGFGPSTPAGTVTFKEGLAPLGTVSVASDGTAALDYNEFGVGDHTVSATFNGNASLGAATSSSIVQKVTSNTTRMTLNLPASSTYGTPYVLSVDIISQSNGVEVEGWYDLTVDGVTTEQYEFPPTNTVRLNLAPGPHTISARFPGNNYYPPSETGVHNITTAKATPTLSHTGNHTLRVGSSFSLTFTLGSIPAGTTPTGTVQLLRGTTVLGSSSSLTSPMTFNLNLGRGSYDVTAVYSGDSNFNSVSENFTLAVFPNVNLAIDALSKPNGIAISAIVPQGTTAMTLYRRVSGAQSWNVVNGWSAATQNDPATLTRGVLYEYRLEATANDVVESSNTDSALMFNDDALAVGTYVKRMHFVELRDAINGLRAAAGLAPFAFDGTFVPQGAVSAAHLAAMRTAVSEARSTLGMQAVTFTDGATPGTTIKAVHIQELRDAAR